MISTNNKNKWVKFDQYTFVSEKHIGPKHLLDDKEVSEPIYYNAWQLYQENRNLALKSIESQDKAPHLQLYKIGKFIAGKDLSDCSEETKKYFDFEDKYKKKELEVGKILRREDYGNDETNDLHYSAELELNKILQEKNKYQDFFIKDKKRKILNWVNNFGLPGLLYESAHKIILSPQWIPFATSFNPPERIERVPASSYGEINNNFLFENYWKEIEGNFIDKDLPRQIINQIEESVFYNQDYIKILKKIKKDIYFGCFQPIIIFELGSWKIKFNYINLFKNKTEEEKLNLTKKILSLKIQNLFNDENIDNGYLRIIKDKDIKKIIEKNENYQKEGIVFKGGDKSKEEKEIKIEGGSCFYGNYGNILKDTWNFFIPPSSRIENKKMYGRVSDFNIKLYIENYERIADLASTVYGLIEDGKSLENLPDEIDNKFQREVLNNFVNTALRILLDRTYQSLNIQFRSESKISGDANFNANSLVGMIGQMIYHDFTSPDKFLLECQNRNCNNLFYATRITSRYCCAKHATAERIKSFRARQKRKKIYQEIKVYN